MRYYSNTAQAATLENAGGISTGTTNIVLSTTNGLPTSFPFTLRLDPDTANEELVSVTSGSGTGGSPYVVTRAYDGTTAKSHTQGSPVVHSGSAADLRLPQEHMANVTPGDVHGLPVSAWNETTIIVKSSDQAYNNDTVLNDDTTLKFNAQASSVYRVELFAMIAGASGGDVKVSWSVPAGATGTRSVIGPATESTTRNNTTVQVGAHSLTAEIGYGLSALEPTLPIALQERFILTTSGTSGMVTMRHAQITSNATVTNVKAGSYMLVTKLS
jgi:hypothetical protein